MEKPELSGKISKVAASFTLTFSEINGGLRVD